MPRNRQTPGFSTPLLVATALTGALALAGCAPAGTSASAASARAATPAPATPAPAPASGSTNIMVYSLNSDGPYASAIVTGAVGDHGSAITIDPGGKPSRDNASDLEFKLTRGSFRLSIAGISRKLVSAASHEPVYPGTCSTFIRVTAATPIVPGSGTGSYRGIRGSFSTTITVAEDHPRPCQPVTGFLRQIIVLAGPGTVSLG